VSAKLARNVGVPLLSLVALLAIWQAVVVVFHVAPYIAPRPMAAIRSVTGNWSLLWPLVLGTLRETVYGFASGAALGFLLGAVMSKIPVLQRSVYPLLVLSQAVPIIALAAPLVLILGFGVAPKVVIVAWIVFFPVTVNVLDGLSHVDPDLINLAHLRAHRGAGLGVADLHRPQDRRDLRGHRGDHRRAGGLVGAVAGRLSGARQLELQHCRGLRHDDAHDGDRHLVVPAGARPRDLGDAVAAALGRAPATASPVTTGVRPGPGGSIDANPFEGAP
jgi:hypothetical protein